MTITSSLGIFSLTITPSLGFVSSDVVPTVVQFNVANLKPVLPQTTGIQLYFKQRLQPHVPGR